MERLVRRFDASRKTPGENLTGTVLVDVEHGLARDPPSVVGVFSAVVGIPVFAYAGVIDDWLSVLVGLGLAMAITVGPFHGGFIAYRDEREARLRHGEEASKQATPKVRVNTRTNQRWAFVYISGLLGWKQ